MKNSITQVSLFIIAFVALSLLMSYTRPAAEEAKEYTVVTVQGSSGGNSEKFEVEVNKKIAQGWHVQGGVVLVGNFWYAQAMVK